MIARFFLILIPFFFVSRIFFRFFGRQKQLQVQNFDVFVASTMCLCVFVATKSKIMLIASLSPLIFSIFLSLRRKKESSEHQILTLLDQILMNMRAGNSFSSTINTLGEQNSQLRMWISRSQGPSSCQTNDQESEIIHGLRVCQERPTLAFNYLSALRTSLRFQNQLFQKQRAVTLQARAQAGTSAALFLLIFWGQIVFEPDFLEFLRATVGKGVVVLSLSLVLCGIWAVFKISRAGVMIV